VILSKEIWLNKNFFSALEMIFMNLVGIICLRWRNCLIKCW